MLPNIHKFLSIFLAGTLLLSLAAPQAAAFSGTYYGDVLLALNPNLSADDLTSGSFSPAGTEEETEDLPETVRSLYTDPASGQEMTVLEVRPPDLVPVEESLFDLPIRFSQTQTTGYEIGATRDFLGVDRNTRLVECLYIGEHCTVWGNTQDDPDITITAEIAQDIGQHFDGYYQDVVAAFGQEYDADGDGKLAIMCYDILNEYPASVSAYTSGLFNAADLVDATGHIENINFGQSSYTNGMDCIHLDTYPGMGSLDDPLGDVPRSYSTLVHEFQHLINFSWQVAGGTHATYVESMEEYLDEAFSMAAEHMVCGADACTSRITYFNGYSYSPGFPLTYWASDLSNYSNSYLFGQYLRTRYGQLTDTDGNTFFQEILAARTPANEDDTLSLMAEKLGTQPIQLVQDFWAAVYLKQPTGVLGFGGEDWAEAISPEICTSMASDYTQYIYNGGARFYALDADGFTPGTTSDIQFISLDDFGIAADHNEAYATLDIAQDGPPLSAAIHSEHPGFATVAFYSPDGKLAALRMASILPGSNTVDLSGLEGDLTGCTWKIILTDEDYAPMCTPFTS